MMSRTNEYYREEQHREDLERQRYEFEQEERWYHEQMELMEETDNLSEVPSTEEELFLQILEDERNENA